MTDCAWCGKVIKSDPVYNYKGGAIVLGEIELIPAYKANFCCLGCAWAFLAETHRLIGLSGKELQNHLIDFHGFARHPGKPAGVMRDDCLIIDIARNLASI